MGRRWSHAGWWLVASVLLVGSCSSESTPPAPAALCARVERQGELRAADITDAKEIAARVAALPKARRVDAALFYHPYGGSIPPGTDTGGLAAEAAGRRLYDLYERRCGYKGP